MRKRELEACGECDADLGGVAIVWCGGCLKPLCGGCAEEAELCSVCDAIMCAACAPRLFSLECAACGVSLHYDCMARRGDPAARVLCLRCADRASVLSADCR